MTKFVVIFTDKLKRPAYEAFTSFIYQKYCKLIKTYIMRGENHVGNESINCIVVERSQCVDDIWEVQSVYAMEHPEEIFLVRDFLDRWKAELRFPDTRDYGHRRVRVAKIVFDDSTIIDDTTWKLPEDEAQRIKALVSGRQKC